VEENSSFKLTTWTGELDGLDGFSDSDWGNSVSRRSTVDNWSPGDIFNHCIMKWRSKMQKTVSLSTAEAEYYAASEMAIKIIYLRNLVENMGIGEKPDTPVYGDNTACIKWSNHLIGRRERAQHIDIRSIFKPFCPPDHPKQADVTYQG
jgi:hypothetical protein